MKTLARTYHTIHKGYREDWYRDQYGPRGAELSSDPWAYRNPYTGG
jgi:hypothetical protein